MIDSKPPPTYEYVNIEDGRGLFKRLATCDEIVLQKVMES
jgi:hypothetical protein